MLSTPPWQRLSQIKEHYDIAIVGGGIYGAATAWEAASRGMRVVLIEAEDFASGTSANSLKTIHGGLRSLQRFDFAEMREYIRERRTLLRIAPHLVSPMQCVIPTYPRFTKSRLFMGIGMKLYDLIACDRNQGLDAARRIDNTQIVTARQVQQLVPGLSSPGMTGGACWFDAQVYNSERLVFAFVMAAKQAGAEVYNYVRMRDYTAEQGVVNGLFATDELTDEDIRIDAGAIIDCRGPWVAWDNKFAETTAKLHQPKLMARAVNLVLDRKLSSCAVGANSRATPTGDNRLMFIAPWRRGSIVGTWYYPPSENSDMRMLSDAELSSCLADINSLFPEFELSKSNVTLIHHGLQPAEEATGESREPKLWRHSRIIDSNRGVLSAGVFWVQGVKLTTARATAEEVVDRVANYLRFDIVPSNTSQSSLYGGEISDYRQFLNDVVSKNSGSLSEAVIMRLARNYGSNLEAIMSLCDQEPGLVGPVPGTDDTIKAELKFILDHEMTYTLSDLLLRRTDIGSFECPAQETIDYCADFMMAILQWSPAQRADNIDRLLRNYPQWSVSYEPG